LVLFCYEDDTTTLLKERSSAIFVEQHKTTNMRGVALTSKKGTKIFYKPYFFQSTQLVKIFNIYRKRENNIFTTRIGVEYGYKIAFSINIQCRWHQ
jgi:hypothetical protein